jgi:hypothetical protein
MSSSTIIISRSNIRLAIVAGIGVLVGLLLGWVIFSHPPLSPSTIPPTALQTAYKAGSAILQGTTPDNLPMGLFTDTFLDHYLVDFPAFIQPMSTTDITWTGTPVVTWTGKNYIDVCLIAHTRVGTLAIEMRLARNEGAWSVDQLLELQLREVN